MPFAFPAVPIPFLQEPTATTEKVDDVLTVEWHHKKIIPGEGKVIFSGGVIARFGLTVIHSDELTLEQGKVARASAKGHIFIEDPEGKLTATTIEFDWLANLGHAEDVEAVTAGLVLHAKTMQMYPDRWELLSVEASPIAEAPNAVKVKAPKIVYRVGKSGTLTRPSLVILGTKLVTLPSYRFGANGEGSKVPLPSISWNQGFGISWRTRQTIDDRSNFTGGIRARSGDTTGITLEATRSLLPRNELEGIVPAVSDQSERFPFGYFDNVSNLRPSQERDFVGRRRSSLTIGSSLNQIVVARKDVVRHSKPIDFALEQGGETRGFGFYSVARYQLVREEAGPTEARAQTGAALLLPEVEIARGLSTHARFDGQGFIGRNNFGWGQAQLGLVYHPSRNLRLGAAYVRAFEAGDPQFAADRLFSMGGYHLRLDADLGPTKFSLLSKYDNNLHKWYDNEIHVRQAMGSLEPFVTFREFPRTLTFGVRLRVEDVFTRLANRGKKNVVLDRP